MISVIRLWNTVNQLAKTSTSGYQTEAEFNNDLADVQVALVTMLAPFYSVNQTVKDILRPFTLSASASAPSGVLPYPTGYFRALTASINGYPAYPVSTNEKDVIMTSPIRMASTTTNQYYYYQEDTSIKILPAQTLTVNLSYIKYPPAATIVLTPVSTDDNDYLTPTVGTDLAWNEDSFNFILFMMLERLGLEQKDSLNMEFSNLGISRQTANI